MSVAVIDEMYIREPRTLSRARAARADAEFDALLVTALPELERGALRVTGRRADAEDLLQETCRRALVARRRFKPGSNMKGWLTCIMRNIHRDRLRQGRREIPSGDFIDSFRDHEPEDRAAWREISDEDLSRAVSSLPPLHRQTYVLHAFDQLPYAEIGRRLGVPPNTVGTRLARARRQIRQTLEATGARASAA